MEDELLFLWKPKWFQKKKKNVCDITTLRRKEISEIFPTLQRTRKNRNEITSWNKYRLLKIDMVLLFFICFIFWQHNNLLFLTITICFVWKFVSVDRRYQICLNISLLRM